VNINLHIERLVLDGLPLEQRQGPRLQAAVARELIRLLSESRSPAGFGIGGNLASVDGGLIEVPESTSPAGLGKQIASAVHGGVGGRQ
jgi:hypothetical protein